MKDRTFRGLTGLIGEGSETLGLETGAEGEVGVDVLAVELISAGVTPFLCKDTQMSIDASLVRTLNSWGEHHRSLVQVCSNDLVYLVILLSGLWLFAKVLRGHPIRSGWKGTIKNLFAKGLVLFVIPAGIAILVSESISAIYVRQRPFVADSNVKLLVPHGVDGGMPSHHIVFMVTLVVSIFYYERGFATFLALLTVLTGVARVVAGIHYPSDIIVGAVLGMGIVYLYRWLLVTFMDRRYLLLD